MICIIWIINLWCIYIGTKFNLEMFVIIPIPMCQNNVWAIVIQHSSFGRKQIQISRQILRQVTDNNTWYIFIGKLILWNSKPLFYNYVFTLFLRNMVVWICIINLYYHLSANFIHNKCNLAVTLNVFNVKYWFFVMPY